MLTINFAKSTAPNSGYAVRAEYRPLPNCPTLRFGNFGYSQTLSEIFSRFLDKTHTLYYNVYMIKYENAVLKAYKRGLIPKHIFEHMHHAFQSLELTKDLTLFDIKRLQGSELREYFRLRKGKYRAIFYFQEDDIIVVKISKREDVYK